jgi:hypothetical protein
LKEDGRAAEGRNFGKLGFFHLRIFSGIKGIVKDRVEYSKVVWTIFTSFLL